MYTYIYIYTYISLLIYLHIINLHSGTFANVYQANLVKIEKNNINKLPNKIAIKLLLINEVNKG